MRYSYIDKARGIGILIVVYVHLSGLGGLADPFDAFASPFALTFFPVLSGGLHALRPPREGFLPFLRKRFFSLLLPYFLYGASSVLLEAFRAYAAVMAQAAGAAVASQASGGAGIRAQALLSAAETAKQILPAYLSLMGYGPQWFLPALFVSELLFYPLAACQDSRAHEEKGRGTAPWKVLAAPGFLLSLALSLFLQCFPDFAFLPMLGYFRNIVTLSLVLQGFLCLGFLSLPRLLRLPRAFHIAFFPFSIAGLFWISRHCIPDFHHLAFGEMPLLLYPAALLGTLSILDLCRGLELLSAWRHLRGLGRCALCRLGDALAYFGRHSLLILCTHLNWYLIHLVAFGFQAVFFPAAAISPRYYLDMLVKLFLVMLMETGLCRVGRNHLPGKQALQ